jgi:hypothetical protein
LYETILTFDIETPNQPMAMFGTWHYDPDVEPLFLADLSTMPGELNLPASQWFSAAAHWQFERPAQFLVYRR